MELMVAPDQFLSNIKSLVSILGAYYCGILIQYSVLPKLFPGRRFLPLWVQLVLGFIPCLVVISTMGPIVACTLADWTFFYMLALICEQRLLVNAVIAVVVRRLSPSG